MNLITDAMAQTAEQPPAATPAETAPAPAPAPTAPAPSAPQPQATQTGTAASGGAPDAASQPPSLPDLFAQLVPVFVVMGIVYILVIRPRARREKAEIEALRNVRRGDVVATTGGVIGKVTKAINDAEVELEIAPNTRIHLLRTAIAEVRSKGEPVKDTPVAPAKPANESKAPAKAAKPTSGAKS
ncbi:MAG: preprotein translocase subunit YajC [Methylocystis sp.]|uniref:preprotein translocase subunit YajC n=1 Tax=Methylocystis sp. TaxID=1911079 RepID=UPI003DA2364E